MKQLGRSYPAHASDLVANRRVFDYDANPKIMLLMLMMMLLMIMETKHQTQIIYTTIVLEKL